METNPKSHTDTIRAMFRDRDSGSVNHIVSHLTQSKIFRRKECKNIQTKKPLNLVIFFGNSFNNKLSNIGC